MATKYRLSLKMSTLGKLCSSTPCSWYVMIADLLVVTKMEAFNTDPLYLSGTFDVSKS